MFTKYIKYFIAIIFLAMIASLYLTNIETSDKYSSSGNHIQWDKNLKFIKNSKYVCSGKSIFLVIFIHSAIHNFDARNFIRKAWASNTLLSGNPIRTVFIVGLTHNLHITMKLEQESMKHNDIIQGNFIDSYRNMTYKHVLGLKWITMFCNHSQFVLKLDDDTLVNVANVINFMLYLPSNSSNKIDIYCDTFKNGNAHRRQNSKWYVSKIEFKDDKYPRYCQGYAYMTTPSIIKKLYESSLKIQFFWIDDVYITGIVAHTLNITHSKSVFPFQFRCLEKKNVESIKCLFVRHS